jgi:hypothetical protein
MLDKHNLSYFVCKSCSSITVVAFYFQTGLLTLQICASFANLAFHLSNATVQITFQPFSFPCIVQTLFLLYFTTKPRINQDSFAKAKMFLANFKITLDFHFALCYTIVVQEVFAMFVLNAVKFDVMVCSVQVDNGETLCGA